MLNCRSRDHVRAMLVCRRGGNLLKSGTMQTFDLLQDLAVVLGVAGVAGWICTRLGLSVVVGFLVAGIIIGPYTPPVALVHDLERIHALSQLGLTFLMFSIGMGLSLRRLHRLGVGVMIATILSSAFAFNAGYLAGLLMNLSTLQCLFIGGMLSVSSSAVVSKILQDMNLTHVRPGQVALGMILTEDIIAVALIAILSSAARIAGEAAHPLGRTVGLMLAFVCVFIVAGLLVVPRLLARINRTTGMDLFTVLVVGLLLGVAMLSVKLGYSLALGAFLLGAIVADTAQREIIARVMQGMRDVFSAIFFVSIGILMDIRAAAGVWHLIVGIALLTLAARAAGASFGLIMIGNPTKESVRSGLMLTPIGEFSFIIAQLGVTAAVLPQKFYPIFVGVSLLTALFAPIFVRHSTRISEAFEGIEPRFLREWIALYHRTLLDARERHHGSLVWRLTRKPLLTAAVSWLLATGLLAFSNTLFAAVKPRLPAQFIVPNDVTIVYWTMLGIVVLVPLLAMWRSVVALALILSELLTRARRQRAVLQPLTQRIIVMSATVVLLIWIWMLLPFDFSAIWTIVFITGALGLFLVFLRQRLTYLHTRVESELKDILSTADAGDVAREKWLRGHREWGVRIYEIPVPDGAACAGRTLAELELRSRYGCSVVGVERQNHPIANPPAEFCIYPGDTLLILATPEKIEPAREFLGTIATAAGVSVLDEMSLEAVAIPQRSHCVGKVLVELDIPRYTGVQVAGIERGGGRVLNPGPFQGLEAGDRLLVIGLARQIDEFKRWVDLAHSPATE
jgi:CPA2 family monovalent cation:H+ antiporter-2